MENKSIPLCVSALVATHSRYHDVRYVGEWKGYSVYCPLDDGGFYGCVFFVLEKNGKARWTDPSSETYEILDFFGAE